MGFVHPSVQGANFRLVSLRLDFSQELLAEGGDLGFGFGPLPPQAAANGSAVWHPRKAQRLPSAAVAAHELAQLAVFERAHDHRHDR